MSKEIIKWNFSYFPLLFLLEQVINNPSEGNLSALYEELRNKEGQLQAYLVLSLTEDQLAQKFRKGPRLTIEDYHLINDNLTRFDKNNTENITKIKQLKEAWQIFIQDSGGRPHSWEAIMVADAFIKLVDLSEKYLSGLEEKN